MSTLSEALWIFASFRSWLVFHGSLMLAFVAIVAMVILGVQRLFPPTVRPQSPPAER